jgi:uncharacterized RDD family membrane protein YckC
MELPQMEYAGFWRRFLPYIIDLMIGFVILVLSLELLSAIHNHIFALGVDLINSLGFLIAILFSAMLTIFCWTHWGMTLGKFIFRIKVVDKNGNKLTYDKSFIRLVGYTLSAIILYLGYLWIAFDEKKQGLHDKMAESFVVKL